MCDRTLYIYVIARLSLPCSVDAVSIARVNFQRYFVYSVIISDVTNPDFFFIRIRTELFDLNIEPEPEFHKNFKGFKLI